MPITITFLTNTSATAEANWKPYEDWAASEVRPQKGELVKLGNGKEMRVVEISITGPRDMNVYLVPTYVKVPTPGDPRSL